MEVVAIHSVVNFMNARTSRAVFLGQVRNASSGHGTIRLALVTLHGARRMFDIHVHASHAMLWCAQLKCLRQSCVQGWDSRFCTPNDPTACEDSTTTPHVATQELAVIEDPKALPAKRAALSAGAKLVRDAWYTLQLGDQAYRAAGGWLLAGMGGVLARRHQCRSWQLVCMDGLARAPWQPGFIQQQDYLAMQCQWVPLF